MQKTPYGIKKAKKRGMRKKSLSIEAINSNDRSNIIDGHASIREEIFGMVTDAVFSIRFKAVFRGCHGLVWSNQES